MTHALSFATALLTLIVPVMAASETPAATQATPQPATTEPVMPPYIDPPPSPAINAALRDHLAPHPRLLLDRAAGKALADRITADPRLNQLKQHLLDFADAVLKKPPIERKLTGRRLLSVSRDALSRIPTLALAYRLTNDPKYLNGARDTMLTIAGFSDFNPSHFLDVAEMTAALSIGYDWLHDDLTPEHRATIRQTIVDKGLKASLGPKMFWIRGTNNWNQVCNGGMTLGALAVADEEPELARRIITRAVDGLPNAIKQYAPDGAYPEGTNYWGYGTTYNTLLLAALNSALGQDFGLSQLPGFLKTADYHLQLVGPSGLNFSYSDGNENASSAPSAAAFYLAGLRRDPSLLFYENRAFEKLLAQPDHTAYREGSDWMLMLFATTNDTSAKPTALHYAANGVTPVATHRSSWDSDATFIAIKGGSPAASHAHMDVGSFCLDADGLRWASDLGMQEYESLESLKIDIWNMKQDAQRWQVFRLGPMSHNILTVNGQGQRVTGHATIVRSTDSFTIVDTSSVYADQLAASTRGIILRPDKSVRLQDEIKATPDAPATVRWAMLTHADVTIDGATATLTQKGKQLQMKVISPANAAIKIISTDPPQDYDAKNPNSRLITFEVALKPGESQTLAVDFTPGSVTAEAIGITPLKHW